MLSCVLYVLCSREPPDLELLSVQRSLIQNHRLQIADIVIHYRKPCKFSHDIRSDHNYGLLRDCTLHELKEDELFLLLLQNDPALLPEVTDTHTSDSALF